MKNLKVFGYVLAGILAVLYLAFLIILPNAVNLNTYKSDLQKVVKDNANLTVDFDRVDLITSPWLEAGIKAKNLSVKLPDGSTLFSAKSAKGKVFLPSLLVRSIRVSCAVIDSPKLNIEILNGENYKVARLYEDIVNKQRKERRLNPPVILAEESSLPVDISKIKIYVPALKLNNYSAIIDDTQAGHKLTLRGEKLKLGYFNGKTAKLKTDAKILSDDKTNITANLDIDTFLPEIKPQEKRLQNDEEVFSLPFVNPVSAYRNYDLKSDINSKLKIRKHRKDNKILMNGFVDVEDTTVTLAGLQLPKSYFRLKSNGTVSEIDTNIYVTDKEYLNLLGTIDYGTNPYVDVALKSPKVHFANILNITRAYLDTVNIPNDIKNMTASGYLLANAKLKTDFRDIYSSGKIIVREGNIADKNIGLIFNDIHANLFFDENVFRVQDSRVLINRKPLTVSGKVDSNSIANFDVKGNKIPLKGLYLAFAPRNVKQSYDLASGVLSIEAKVTGEIKDISALLKTDLDNLVLRDRAGNFVVNNKFLRLGVANISGKITGKLTNKGFNFNLPKTGSNISDDELVVNLNNKMINAQKSKIRINKQSDIYFEGKVKNYLTDAKAEFFADGQLSASDLGFLAGKDAMPYFAIKGFIPIKARFTAQGNKMKLIAQAKANEGNYITPVRIKSLEGKQTLLQLIVNKNGDNLKISKSGLFTRKAEAPFGDKLYSNLSGANEVVSVRAMVSNLSTNPFINLFKISIPRDVEGSIYIFPKSRFILSGNLFAFGDLDTPRVNGTFNIHNLSIPEIQTQMRQGVLHLDNRNLSINLNDINANGSDFAVAIKSNLDLISKMILSDVRISSRLINVDKLMVVSDNLMKSLPSSFVAGSVQNANIPVTIQNGGIRFNRIKTGNITANNTTGRISLYNNIFYLNRLRTHTMKGVVNGDVSMNLITTELNAKVRGRNFDVEQALLEAMDMKDTLSGNMNFTADISLRGTTMEEQMKTLKGFVDFNIKDGQLGPFGKIENFLMAENIRENPFFSSTIGSVITNIVTIDTSHFNYLYGHLTFKDGIANIAPIKSQGDVMSMYIAGTMDLIDNSAGMKVRAKLASVISDSLGPLANINPVNLVKNTPGLNVVAAKSFSIFCEEVSEEEMKAVPHLGKGKTEDNATKFQIVLRGDTRKPLKMIKSFKWLALDSEIQSAQDFVDTIPEPVDGEEGLSVEELIQIRQQQKAVQVQRPVEESETNNQSVKNKKK